MKENKKQKSLGFKLLSVILVLAFLMQTVVPNALFITAKAYSDEFKDGTVKDVYITYNGVKYYADLDIRTKPLKPMKQTNPIFGLTAGEKVPTQILTFKNLPKEALDEKYLSVDAYVNVAMNTDVQFRIKLGRIKSGSSNSNKYDRDDKNYNNSRTGSNERQNNNDDKSETINDKNTPLGKIANEKNATLPFTDIKKGNWAYDAIAYNYKNKIFTGTSKTTFSPNEDMTRAMVVTILYSLSKDSAVSTGNDFKDVKAGSYYEDALNWAVSKDIVHGVSATKFAPDAKVSREQMVKLIYKYTEYKGINVSETSTLKMFTDNNQVSDYAKIPMKWAVAKGIIKGTPKNTIDPKGKGTRAEVAVMIQRFVEAIK